jgi:hypothetical protein
LGNGAKDGASARATHRGSDGIDPARYDDSRPGCSTDDNPRAGYNQYKHRAVCDRKPGKLITDFPEPDLSKPSEFRTPAAGLVNIAQDIVNNPNLVLTRKLVALGGRRLKITVVLAVSSDASTPVLGGGTANTAFLQGSPSEGPNAQAAIVTATFWIETVESPVAGAPISTNCSTPNAYCSTSMD